VTPYDPAVLSFAQAHLAPLAALTERRRYKKGQIVFLRGEVLLDAFLLARGSATALYAPSRGDNAIELVPGDFFGEDVLVSEGISKALVHCEEDDTVVLAIPAAQLKALLDVNPLLKRTVIAQISHRLSRLRDGGHGGLLPDSAFN
jgi:CRP-like cAMP-binding protein